MKQQYKCDSCGQYKDDVMYPVYDEQYNTIEGLLQCDECFLNND